MGSGNSKANTSGSGGSNSLSVPSLKPPSYQAVTPPGSKKYAVLIGINYTGTNNKLNGCINDVTRIRQDLDFWNFDEIAFMTDNSSGSLYPTKANIINQLNTFVNKLTPNDILVIYYSGHGTRVTDRNSDEISGLDSVIVPINFNYIVDDEIRSILVNAVAGSNIFAVFDSCNSGSVCDLRYNLFDTSYKENPGIKVKDYSDFVTRQNIFTNTNYAETNANIISLSGSKDDQLSVEQSFITDSGSTIIGGALSYFILKVFREKNLSTLSFSQFLALIKYDLSRYKFTQVPSLMSGKQFDDSNTTIASFLKI
jgi:hypothetical protein